MTKYQLGLVSVSFRQHTPEEILQAVQRAGLTCVEWGSDVHAPCGNSQRLKRIADLQERYGVRCASYGTYFRLGHTPMEELTAYIAAAKLLGTRILRLWCGDRSGARMTSAERADLLIRCRRAADIAEEQDVILCMECHGQSLTERPEDVVALMETVRSPHFRMYWQPFQWLDEKGNTEMARVVAPYAEHIHVFNWKGAQRYPLAEAEATWKAYLTAFSTPRTLLLEFMPDDRIETLPREAAALRSMIGGEDHEDRASM